VQKSDCAALAQDLDALESHIERYGSVVIQHPSVWGQARLTKHREDFEKIMQKDLCSFKLALQGSSSRSDQAYFANAFALGMAVSGPKAVATAPAANSNSTTTTSAINIPSTDDQSATFKALSDANFTRTGARLPTAIGFSLSGAEDKITVEPSVYLNQKARYLQHLNELRRINEGDDTGDSPGYSLNLIRVPVSVLPGKHTQHGYGAEVTMSLKPHLGDELLPTNFSQSGDERPPGNHRRPLTHFLNDKDQVDHFKIIWKVYDAEYEIWKNLKKVKSLKFKDLSAPSRQLLKGSPMAKELGLLDRDNAAWRNTLGNAQLIVPATKLRHASGRSRLRK